MTTFEQYEQIALRLEQVARGYRLDMRRPGQTASQLDCLSLRADEADISAAAIRHLCRALLAACEALCARGHFPDTSEDALADVYLAATAELEEADR